MAAVAPYPTPTVGGAAANPVNEGATGGYALCGGGGGGAGLEGGAAADRCRPPRRINAAKKSIL